MQKLRKEKDHINDLIAQGEVDKADELKKDIAWKKAFDKTDGKKVSCPNYFDQFDMFWVFPCNLMSFRWPTFDN